MEYTDEVVANWTREVREASGWQAAVDNMRAALAAADRVRVEALSPQQPQQSSGPDEKNRRNQPFAGAAQRKSIHLVSGTLWTSRIGQSGRSPQTRPEALR